MPIKTPDFWYRKKLCAYLLLPLSSIYLFLSFARKLFARPISLSKNTITIGNITVGGGGKTPLTLNLAEYYTKKGNKICILTKGYKGKEVGPYLVQKDDSALKVGDEALLFAQKYKCILAKKRKSALDQITKISPDILLLDDGFQDPNIKSDCLILVIDNNFLFGNELIFPAGPIRSNISTSIQKADILLVIKSEKSEPINARLEKIARKNSKKIFSAYPQITSNKEQTEYLAFSGLALNQKFFTSLEKGNYKVKIFREFSDHYHYKEKDLIQLIELANSNDLKLITTEKDIVKIPQKFRKYITIYPYKITIEQTDYFCDEISKIMQRN